jgi:opacity protein-like surface antigen
MFISRLARHCLLAFVIAAALPAVALAQYGAPPPPRPAWAGPRQPTLELSAFTGWSVNSDPDTTYGRLSIGDAQSFGAALAIASGFGASLELKWIYFQPTVQLVGSGINFANSTKFDVDTHYFLIGGSRGIRRGIVEPFFGGSLGAVVYLPNSFSLSGINYNPGDTWRMAFALGGGVKLFVHPKLALRLGAELLGTVYIYGASFYTGTNGSAMGVTGGIPTVSGNFTLGLTFAP